MDNWLLIVLIGAIAAATAAFVWLATRLERQTPKHKHSVKDASIDAVEKDVEHIFNDEFREELRNRGRVHFEKIIGENAMFLQQDLRLTTSQVNEFMKAEITKKLQEEFGKYEQSINDAKQLALESISKTQEAIEQQRQMLGQQLTAELEKEKQTRLQRFDENLAEIVNHYIMAAVGNQIDLNDQLEFIIGELETNKAAILEDLQHGS